MNGRPWAVVLGAVLVAAVGCGGGGKAPVGAPSGGTSGTSTARGANGMEALPPQEIVSRSAQALKDGRSARAVGALSSGSEYIDLNLALNTDADCAGSMTLGTEGGFQLVKLGTQLWIKPDQVFWEAHGAEETAKVVGDRYLRTTSDDADFGDVTALCDLGQLADSIGAGGGQLAKGTTTSVSGTAALAVTGQDQDGGAGTLYVAVEGPPYPLRLEKGGGHIDFTDFGKPVPRTVPPPEQTIDIDQLRQPGSAGSAATAAV